MSEVIALSVADTNELRAKLGLKPLKLATDETVAIQEACRPPAEVPKRTTKTDLDLSEGKRLMEEISSGGGILDWDFNDSKKVKPLGDPPSSSDSDESSSEDPPSSRDSDGSVESLRNSE